MIVNPFHVEKPWVGDADLERAILFVCSKYPFLWVEGDFLQDRYANVKLKQICVSVKWHLIGLLALLTVGVQGDPRG